MDLRSAFKTLAAGLGLFAATAQETTAQTINEKGDFLIGNHRMALKTANATP